MSIRNPETLGNEACYTAHKRCGCMVAAIVDKPEHATDVQRQIAQWERRGLSVKHAKVFNVWAGFTGWNCPHELTQEAFS